MKKNTTIPWQKIDSLFLDLDGTLLDKHFDDYFWETHVPKTFAAQNGLQVDEAKKQLLSIYRSMENTLHWSDLDYWSARLDLDIVALKYEISDLIRLRPDVLDFFAFIADLGKHIFLITNAHPKTLAVKLAKVQISQYFERIICSQNLGFAKEQPEFWQKLQEELPHRPKNIFFADDTEKVLTTAQEAGVGHLVHIANPNSRLSPRYSEQFISISSFTELMA
jgi:HAD superfamily hydrolase (TIGR01509 family)